MEVCKDIVWGVCSHQLLVVLPSIMHAFPILFGKKPFKFLFACEKGVKACLYVCYANKIEARVFFSRTRRRTAYHYIRRKGQSPRPVTNLPPYTLYTLYSLY
jgi:hypothetical protein